MRAPFLRISLAVLLVLAGCGGSSTTDAGTDSGSATDSGTPDSGGSDAGGRDAGGSDAGGSDAGGSDAGGSDAGGSDAGDTDAGDTDAGNADAGGSDGGGTAVVCTGHSVTSFPTFDQSCASASDCVIVVHQTDCCGDSHTLAVRTTEVAAFNAAEASCEAMSPACGCAAHPSVTDSGESVTGTPAMVTCFAPGGGPGTCFTYVAAPPP